MAMGVFPPVAPPTVPTPQRILDSAVSSRANAMFLVPSFLEVRSALIMSHIVLNLTPQTWSLDEEAVKTLTGISPIVRVPEALRNDF